MFNPWVGKIPWRRKWQPAPVFLPGKSYGQRSLVGYSSWGLRESDMTEHTHTHTEDCHYRDCGRKLFRSQKGSAGLQSGRAGLPWWLRGKESPCQGRGHRSDPRSTGIPHGTEQRSPRSTTMEPVPWSLGAATAESCTP